MSVALSFRTIFVLVPALMLAAVNGREGGAFLPARPFEETKVLELLDMGEPGPAAAPAPRDLATQAVLAEVPHRAQKALRDLTLADVTESR